MNGRVFDSPQDPVQMGRPDRRSRHQHNDSRIRFSDIVDQGLVEGSVKGAEGASDIVIIFGWSLGGWENQGLLLIRLWVSGSLCFGLATVIHLARDAAVKPFTVRVGHHGGREIYNGLMTVK